MRLSQRTNWKTEENDLARAHRLRLAAGLPIADLTASNPTRCGFAYDPALLAPLADPRALIYDPQPLGQLTARQAVCAYYADHGLALTPEHIILTTSTSEAYSFLFRLLCDPGDELLILQPGYPLFDFLAALDDLKLIAAPIQYDHGWQIDPEALRRAITPRTRAIVLVHPNNPTGHFTKPWEIKELEEVFREHDLALIVDEVFLDYSFGEPAQSFAAGVDGVNVFVVSGLSKIAGLPQMKAAWIVMPEAKSCKEEKYNVNDFNDIDGSNEVFERLEVISDTFLSMNAPVQCAIPAWIAGRASIQRQIDHRVTANLAALDRQLVPLPEVTRLKVEGGWYAILHIPNRLPDEETVLALLERGLWLHPGYFFGMSEIGWLVLSLLTPEEEFHRGLVILINYMKEK